VIQADRLSHALQAPVAYMPTVQIAGAGSELTFSSNAGNGIRISDVDSQNSLLEVRLSVGTGTLNLVNTANLTFLTGDGHDDSTIVVRGTLVNVNAALEGLGYTPYLTSRGTTNLDISVLDTGTGLSSTNSVAISIIAANNPPANNVPVAQEIGEHQTLTFSQANGNGISIDDPDINAATDYVTIRDNNFESPDLGSGATAYQYGVLGTGWTFTGTSGIAANGSSFGNSNAPSGDQVGFIQNGGMISQSFTVAEAGLYTISFEVAAKSGAGDPLYIEIDGVSYGLCTPNSTSFQTYRSASISLTASIPAV
jgi:hypothetical protein